MSTTFQALSWFPLLCFSDGSGIGEQCCLVMGYWYAYRISRSVDLIFDTCWLAPEESSDLIGLLSALVQEGSRVNRALGVSGVEPGFPAVGVVAFPARLTLFLLMGAREAVTFCEHPGLVSTVGTLGVPSQSRPTIIALCPACQNPFNKVCFTSRSNHSLHIPQSRGSST